MEKIIKRREAVSEALKKDYREEAQRIVNLLESAGFKFSKIYLFGSVSRDAALSSWSDIDLAIEGLPEEMYYKAYAFLLKKSRFAIDLKPFEQLDAMLKEKIRKKGMIVYEKE
ncbi:nucleotidyltransferase domain-containing protein [candidate division KSB1 bacterium]|nr:nucleotidyltransferase domain-containing protein [candidate division KSB1 bacterium]MBL7095214.1 nucleotidyltransferase domain-containing protein [candidate division KSB1 bacterium]